MGALQVMYCSRCVLRCFHELVPAAVCLNVIYTVKISKSANTCGLVVRRGVGKLNGDRSNLGSNPSKSQRSVAQKFKFLRCHYYVLLGHYYIIITPLFLHYYLVITLVLLIITTLLLHIVTSLLRHFYVIFRLFYLIITSSLHIHYYIIITLL